MEKDKIVYSKKETGLPFDIVKDSHFPNYKAKHSNGMTEDLTCSDIIMANILKKLNSSNTKQK